MPNKNGIEMLEELNEKISDLKVPIVIISTEYSPELKEKTKSLGAVAWLIKPVTRQAINTLVKNVIK